MSKCRCPSPTKGFDGFQATPTRKPLLSSLGKESFSSARYSNIGCELQETETIGPSMITMGDVVGRQSRPAGEMHIKSVLEFYNVR